MIVYILLIVLVLVLTLLYFVKSDYREFWRKRGVPYYSGRFGLGVFGDFLMQNRSLFEIFDEIYKAYPDAPVVALATAFKPIILVKDPENIQHVLAGDFNNYNHRGVELNTDIDPLGDNLLFMTGTRWKLTRQKLSPLFTSAKLRNMYYIMDKSAQDFVTYLKENNNKENAMGALSAFCSAAINASVFGIHTESTMESPFLNIARRTLVPSSNVNIKFTIATVFPRLFSLLRLTLFTEFQDFFIDSIKKVIRMRDKENIRKHDFADLCLAIQKSGTMNDPGSGYEMEPTDELLAAQAFFFFLAGVDTSSISMFFTLFEMARHPDILKRVHEEIDNSLDGYNETITYEKIMALEYLDKVMDEALRMHPPIGSLARQSTQVSVLPVGNVLIEKDMPVNIPVLSIHLDPKYYPNPEIFDPERFTPEAKQQRRNYTYMPFGEGNRMCIGLRFARLQVKTGIVHLLREFTVKTKADIKTKVEFVKSPVQLRPSNVDFEFVPRTL